MGEVQREIGAYEEAVVCWKTEADNGGNHDSEKMPEVQPVILDHRQRNQRCCEPVQSVPRSNHLGCHGTRRQDANQRRESKFP
ncbi:MAG: hypothetical protein ACRETN_05755, partial [Nevskiales bacterium]